MDGELDRTVLKFKASKIAAQLIADKALVMSPERFTVEVFEHELGVMIRGVLNVLTREEPELRVPADWWQAFKARWFPRWLQRLCPIKYNLVISHTIFPELEIPVELLGKRFVTLKVVPDDYFEREV